MGSHITITARVWTHRTTWCLRPGRREGTQILSSCQTPAKESFSGQSVWETDGWVRELKQTHAAAGYERYGAQSECGYKWRDESGEGSQGGRTEEHVEEVTKGLYKDLPSRHGGVVGAREESLRCAKRWGAGGNRANWHQIAEDRLV